MLGEAGEIVKNLAFWWQEHEYEQNVIFGIQPDLRMKILTDRGYFEDDLKKNNG